MIDSGFGIILVPGISIATATCTFSDLARLRMHSTIYLFLASIAIPMTGASLQPLGDYDFSERELATKGFSDSDIDDNELAQIDQIRLLPDCGTNELFPVRNKVLCCDGVYSDATGVVLGCQSCEQIFLSHCFYLCFF